MKCLIQRVTRASVRVAGQCVGSIDAGLLVLVAVERDDDVTRARACAEKLRTLRIFSDLEGKMNLDVREAGGSVLVVSQFTLLADTRKGRRPSLGGGADPDAARPILTELVSHLRGLGLNVAEGRFGANMQVELVNDGPVTLWVET